MAEESTAPLAISPPGEAAWLKAAKDKRLDELTRILQQFPPADFKYEHIFTHGPDGKINLYTRILTVPGGRMSISKIHKTEHPYQLVKGSLSHWSMEGNCWVRIFAPHISITKPGTRRITFTHEECIMMTSHVTDTDDLAEIERQVIHAHDVLPLPDFTPPPQ